MKRVLPGVYYFTGLLVGRVYLIRDPDGFTVIDTGLTLAADRIVRQITAAGAQPRDVRRILITHAHPDHVGGLPRLQALTGAQVWASAIERPVIEGRAPIPRPAPDALPPLLRGLRPPEVRLPGTPVDRELQDGEVLPEVLGGLQVVFTPGHAPGHLAFWQPARRILFCGDAIMRVRPQIHLPLRILTADMATARHSVGRLAALDTAVLCLGHGDPLRHDAAAAIRALAMRAGAG